MDPLVFRAHTGRFGGGDVSGALRQQCHARHPPDSFSPDEHRGQPLAGLFLRRDRGWTITRSLVGRERGAIRALRPPRIRHPHTLRC
jgi:hypothetical protein